MTKDILTGRIAKCTYCNREEPSSPGLWFFEYLGEGSTEATRKCGTCGFYDVTHEKINPSTGRPGNKYGDHEFTPKGDVGHDRYYCACRGTD